MASYTNYSKEYTVKFEVYGRTGKATVKAQNPEAAKNYVLEMFKITAVYENKTEDPSVEFLKNMFKMK
jgi:hypothetical protein